MQQIKRDAISEQKIATRWDYFNTINKVGETPTKTTIGNISGKSHLFILIDDTRTVFQRFHYIAIYAFVFHSYMIA